MFVCDIVAESRVDIQEYMCQLFVSRCTVNKIFLIKQESILMIFKGVQRVTRLNSPKKNSFNVTPGYVDNNILVYVVFLLSRDAGLRPIGCPQEFDASCEIACPWITREKLLHGRM